VLQQQLPIIDRIQKRMKIETKELVRTLGIALAAMLVVPLAYRVYIYIWPPEEKMTFC